MLNVVLQITNPKIELCPGALGMYTGFDDPDRRSWHCSNRIGLGGDTEPVDFPERNLVLNNQVPPWFLTALHYVSLKLNVDCAFDVNCMSWVIDSKSRAFYWINITLRGALELQPNLNGTVGMIARILSKAVKVYEQ